MSELETPSNVAVVETPENTEPEVKLTETEQEAYEQGWRPKDEFKGKEDDWVPAKAYIKYGQIESELKKTRSDASQKERVIKTMKDYYLNVKEDAKKEIISSFRKQKREAVKEQNYEEAARLDVQIEELTDNLDRRFKTHDDTLRTVEQQVPNTPPPEFFEWNKKNQWYVLGSTEGLTKEADVLAVSYAQLNPSATHKEVMNWVTDRIKLIHASKFENPARSRPSDVNEPGEVIGESDNKKKVKLSQAEKAAAEAFGMTQEAYAEGLKRWDKMKGVQ